MGWKEIVGGALESTLSDPKHWRSMGYINGKAGDPRVSLDNVAPELRRAYNEGYDEGKRDRNS